MTQSLHGFCNAHNLSKATVYRWLKAQGYDLAQGLSQDALDAALAQFVPMTPEVQTLPPETTGGTIERFSSRTNPLVPIEIGTLNINITQANTRQLEDETARFHQVSAAALQGIGEFIQADLVGSVHSAIAQNRHAVAGLNAQAASNLANSLGKSPQTPVEVEDDV